MMQIPEHMKGFVLIQVGTKNEGGFVRLLRGNYEFNDSYRKVPGGLEKMWPSLPEETQRAVVMASVIDFSHMLPTCMEVTEDVTLWYDGDIDISKDIHDETM